ncbi:hypothetical protein JMJ35_003042 [Cladonia borealis]|uniref:Uncharacterized protein n=1 Tax=Cladonia borealis TaxID=184061 RepID=A0AA39V949_9LECA|nr:hypothetical protein JMJ35_003042 [Cladonia borealis]
MDNQSKPTISVSISITPATHSYANQEAPNLNLIITSHYSEPITIYADDLSPSLMLACGAFTITCLNNGCEIGQACRTHCRIPPPTKVAVTLNEQLFHTLLPNEPITISAPFSRNRPETGGKPLAKSDPNYVSDRVRASSSASGVDGLEPGNDYVLTLGDSPHVHWKTVRWWEYGTKEQVLHPDDKENALDGRKVKWGRAPHEAIEIDTTSIGPVMFHCRE